MVSFHVQATDGQVRQLACSTGHNRHCSPAPVTCLQVAGLPAASTLVLQMPGAKWRFPRPCRYCGGSSCCGFFFTVKPSHSPFLWRRPCAAVCVTAIVLLVLLVDVKQICWLTSQLLSAGRCHVQNRAHTDMVRAAFKLHVLGGTASCRLYPPPVTLLPRVGVNGVADLAATRLMARSVVAGDSSS